MNTPILTIELVPSTCWFSNVRNHVSRKYWDLLRKEAYAKNTFRCEICNKNSYGKSLECHEIFEYNDDIHIQKLTKLVALCKKCHMVKHFGLATKMGRRPVAISHLCKINNWTKLDAETYVENCYTTWITRSNYIWKLDLSYLDNLNIPIINLQ